MVLSFKRVTDSVAIRMRGDLVIRNARSIYRKVDAAIEKARDVSIYLDDVREVDSAGVQLLLHFIFRSDMVNRPISMISPPPSLIKLIEVYGVDSIFSDVIRNEMEDEERRNAPVNGNGNGNE